MSKRSASSSSSGCRPSATLGAGEVGAALGTGIGVPAVEGKAAGALLGGLLAGGRGALTEGELAGALFAAGRGALTEGEPAFACPTGAGTGGSFAVGSAGATAILDWAAKGCTGDGVNKALLCGGVSNWLASMLGLGGGVVFGAGLFLAFSAASSWRAAS